MGILEFTGCKDILIASAYRDPSLKTIFIGEIWLECISIFISTGNVCTGKVTG